MKDYILSADLKIRNSNPTPTPPPIPTTETSTATKDRLFLHMEFHRNDIPKSMIRTIYEHTCQDTFSEELGINQFTICYSRSTNIKESLTKAKLHQAPGKEASKFYSGELPTT